MPNPIPVVYNGVTYKSVAACCEALGIPRVSYNRYCEDNNLDKTQSIDAYLSREVRNKPWGAEELAILKEWYPVEGSKVSSRLPGRTLVSIFNCVRKLGIRAPGSSKVIFYEGVEYKTLADMCKATGVDAHRYTGWCRDHGVDPDISMDLFLQRKTVRQWSSAEDALIKEHYPAVGSDVLSLLPKDVSVSALRARVNKLGVHYIPDEYVFRECPVCGAKVLLERTEVADYTHGPMCEQYLWEEV